MSSYILASNEDGNIVLSKRSRKENESVENHNDEASSSMNNNTIVLPPSKRTKSDDNMIFENVTQTSSTTTTTNNKPSPTTEESSPITTTTPSESALNNDDDKMDVDDTSDENQNNHNIEKQVDIKHDIHDINIVLEKDVTIQKQQQEEEETSLANKTNVLPQPKLTININNLDQTNTSNDHQTNTSNNHPSIISPHPVRIPTPHGIDTNITKEQNEISNLLLLASSTTTTTTTTTNKDEEDNNDDEQSSSTSTINTSKDPSNNTTISNKKKELIQTNLDKQFNVIKTKRRIKTTVYKMTSKNQENKQTTTDKDVMQLIGTITFPFTNILKITNDNNGDDDDDHTNNESSSTLHYPRVMQNEIYINSKSQANSVRVSEQGSLLELKKYRQQKFEEFSNKMKDFEKKKRDEQKKLLNERMLKVQNHASKLLVLKHGHDSIINNTSKDEQEKMAKSQEGKRQRYILYLH